MTMVIDGTNGLTFPAGSSQLQAGNYQSMVNRIINGRMEIDQRALGTWTNTTSDTYTLDRWQFGSSQASKFTAQQSSTAPTGFINSMLITSSSAYTVGASETFNLIQRIEGLNCTDLAWGSASAQTVTLSFWVRSSLTGTFGGALTNSAFNRSYPYSYTISSANTWEYKTVTIAGDTSGTWLTTNGVGVYLGFSMGAHSGSTTTAGSWGSTTYYGVTGQTNIVATSGATWYVTGVQFEVGTAATPFERRLYGHELDLCQRDFFKVTNRGSRWLQTSSISSGNMYGTIPFQVNMRAVPTASVPSTTTFDIWGVGNPTTIALDDATTEWAVIKFTKSTLTNYYAYVLSGDGGSTFQFSAEL